MPRGGERPVCSVPGCGRPHKAKGFCDRHYQNSLYIKHNNEKPQKTCSVEGCLRRRLAKGLCNLHYTRVYRTGETGQVEVIKERSTTGLCSVPGCNKPHAGLGFCRTHYSRAYRDHVNRRCSVVGCNRKAISQLSDYCDLHYRRMRRNGVTGSAEPLKRKSDIGDWRQDECGKWEQKQADGTWKQRSHISLERAGVRLDGWEKVYHIDGDVENDDPRNLNIRDGKRIVKCVVCGTSVVRFLSSNTASPCCSLECVGEYNKRRLTKLHDIKCPTCGRTFKPQVAVQKYCCRTCCGCDQRKLSDDQIIAARYLVGAGKLMASAAADVLGVGRPTMVHILGRGNRPATYRTIPLFNGGEDEFLLEVVTYRSQKIDEEQWAERLPLCGDLQGTSR